MFRSMFRPGLLVLALFLSALLLLAHGAPAQADSPEANIRIFRTREWFDAHRAEGTQAVKKLQYYGGRVMNTSTTYAIYWTPPGHGVSKSYRKLIERYFQDVGGSSLYNILTQYYENPGAVPIQNVSTFGGAWVDKVNPYPHSGSSNDPLKDSDIRAEVYRAIQAKGWPTGYGAEYFVFTGPGVNSCINSTVCTPGTPNPAFCAYHGHFVKQSNDILYANMPYAASFGASCGLVSKSPNNNAAADTEISIVSHEHFEAVTDADPPPGGPEPPTTAWTDSDGYEISDKCAYEYGAIKSNGSNMKLNGNPYIIQLEFSNLAAGGVGDCVKK